MHNQPTPTMTVPQDPREQAVLQIRDYPDPPLHLVVPSTPWIAEAVTDASRHLARQAQRAEREKAIEANLLAASEDLHRANIVDSAYAFKVAQALPPDQPTSERYQAGAVAVRLHDRLWADVTRYRAAQAALITLRKLLSASGIVGVVAESDLRGCADDLAQWTQIARMRTWDGSEPVTARDWARARLGLLSVREER